MKPVELKVPVLGVDGRPVSYQIERLEAKKRARYERVPDERKFINAPLSLLFPDRQRDVVLVDVRGQELGKDPLRVEYDGRTFQAMYSGNSVKDGLVLCVHGQELTGGLFQTAEQFAAYGQRYLLGQGAYGAEKGTFRIKIVGPGESVGFHTTADGVNFIARDLAERMDLGLRKVYLHRARQGYMQASYIDRFFPGVEAELEALLAEQNAKLFDPDSEHGLAELRMTRGLLKTFEKYLVDDEMFKHPAANSMASSQAKEFWMRVASSLPFETINKLAVPLPYGMQEEIVMPDMTGKVVAYRMPIDGPTLQALLLKKLRKLWEFLDALEVFQGNLCGLDIFDKGVYQIVERRDLNGADLWLCTDNQKMCTAQLKPGDLVEIDAVVCANMWYAPGSCMGVNARWAKDAEGLDFDGDIQALWSCERFPATWAAVQALKRFEIKTPKVPKTSSPPEEFWSMVLQNQKARIGEGSNTLQIAISDGIHDAAIEEMANMVKLKPNGLFSRLNLGIKVPTDQIKRKISPKLLTSIEDFRYTLRARARDRLNGEAPHIKWASTPEAFSSMVPGLGYDPSWSPLEKEMAVPDSLNGTVAWIARQQLPLVQLRYEIEGVTSNTLSHYSSWAVSPYAAGEEPLPLKDAPVWYVQRASAADLRDGNEQAWLSADAQLEGRKLAKTLGLDAWQTAQALWVYAHNGRKQVSHASCVFEMFPDECLRIIRDKPGLQQQIEREYKLLGLAKQLGDRARQPITIKKGEIREITMVDKQSGKNVYRMVLVANLGQRPAGPPFPDWHLGTFDSRSEQPPAGVYQVHIQPTGFATVWLVTLS